MLNKSILNSKIILSINPKLNRGDMNRRHFIKASSIALAAGSAVTRADKSTSALHEGARDIPVVGQYDVLVCGAGPAGVAASISAARRGAKTMLLDVNGCLGGIWTVGALSWILDYENKDGIMREIFNGLERRGARSRRPDGKPSHGYDVEAMKVFLDELVLDAGVSVQYFTRAVDVAKTDRRVTHVITESKSGREAIAAKVFLDCTGDGDVSALAGCQFDIGRPNTGETQPMSYMAILTGLQPNEIKDFYWDMISDWAAPKLALKKEMEKAGVSPSYAKPTLFHIRDDMFAMMANHEYGVRGINAREVTTATLRGRKEVHQLVDGLRGLSGPWKDIRIVATSAHIGVREGRRIHGRYMVTSEDLRTGARFDDAVCRVTFNIDVHATDPTKEKGIEPKPFHSQPYDIPLRALIAKDVDGLMMAGRNISGDFFAHSSYRVTGNAVAMGEAAGACAAVAAERDVLPHQVKWADVRMG